MIIIKETSALSLLEAMSDQLDRIEQATTEIVELESDKLSLKQIENLFSVLAAHFINFDPGLKAIKWTLNQELPAYLSFRAIEELLTWSRLTPFDHLTFIRLVQNEVYAAERQKIKSP